MDAVIKVAGLAFAALLLLAPTWCAQEGIAPRPRRGEHLQRGEGRFGPPPWERRSARGERAERERIRQLLMASFDRAVGKAPAQSAARERFEAMTRQLAFRLPLEALRELVELAESEAVRRIVELWQAQRREADERFLALLDPATAAEVSALEGEAFHRRVSELRAERILDRALASARLRGLVTEDEEAAMRAADSGAKVRFAEELNKRVFLALWNDRLTAEQRARLEPLAPHRFFRDPLVRRFRLSGHLGDDDLDRVRTMAPARRRELLDALRLDPPADFAAFDEISEATRTRLRELPSFEREHLARELERVHFAERVRARVERWLLEHLPEADRERFGAADDEEKLRILAERFGDAEWRREAERALLQRLIERRLGPSRSALHADDPEAALREQLTPAEAEDLLPFLRRLEALGGARPQRPGGKPGGDASSEPGPLRRGEGERRRPHREKAPPAGEPEGDRSDRGV